MGDYRYMHVYGCVSWGGCCVCTHVVCVACVYMCVYGGVDVLRVYVYGMYVWCVACMYVHVYGCVLCVCI